MSRQSISTNWPFTDCSYRRWNTPALQNEGHSVAPFCFIHAKNYNSYAKHLLRQTPFTPNACYARHLLHQRRFTPETFYTRDILHQRRFTPDSSYTRDVLHQGRFTPETFYTRDVLHQTALTPETFYTKQFYTRQLSFGRGVACTSKVRSLVTPNLDRL